MRNKKENAVVLLLDGCRGINIPRDFSIKFNLEQWGFTLKKSEELQDCLSDVENEYYWETWDYVLDNAVCVLNGNTYNLYQDGDLWALCYENMTKEEKQNFEMED